MKLKAFGLAFLAILACSSAFAQTDNQGDNSNKQKTQKPLNDAEVQFQNRVIAAADAYKAGNTDESLHQFEQLHSENPNHKDVVSWLGFLYVRTNQPDKAVPILEKASEMSPDD